MKNITGRKGLSGYKGLSSEKESIRWKGMNEGIIKNAQRDSDH